MLMTALIMGTCLNYFVEANNFHSHINEPTPITERSATCLDRIVSNIPHYVETAQVLDPLLHNDHCTVGITLRFSIPKSQSYSRLMRDYSRGDYEGLREHIKSIDWNMICENFTDIDFAANLYICLSVYPITFDVGGIERSNQDHGVLIWMCSIDNKAIRDGRPRPPRHQCVYQISS